MKSFTIRLIAALAAFAVALSCEPEPVTDDSEDKEQTQTPEPDPDPDPDPDPEPEPDSDPEPEPEPGPAPDPYASLESYDYLKNYVDRTQSPDFKMGAAINVSQFLQRGQLYDLAVENLDEMTAENAMKYSSVVGNDGSMNFSQVRNFLDMAESAGLTVYGHTLAWHSQQRPAYLNGLIADRKVENPSQDDSVKILLEDDFNDGNHPFIHWGNNSVISVSDGTFKISNPSYTDNWRAQFAHDFSSPFINGQSYRMSFRIRGSGSGTIAAGFQIIDGYKSAGEFGNVTFSTDWKTVEVECTCNADGAVRIVFSFGSFAGDIYIDDFTLSQAGQKYILVQMTPDEKKQVLTDAMDRWIKGMMEVTASRVSVWDAVNESISGSDRDGDGFYELESGQWGSSNHFYWQDYLGSEDYVRIVVAKARKYYSDYGGTEPLRLFINDYNLESDWDDLKKLKSLIHWIGIWESDGVTHIDGIGTQMHISYYENPGTQASKSEHIVKMLQLMADTGKLVKITELDMGYVNSAGTTLSIKELSEDQHKAMADYYQFIVSKYFEIVPPAQQYGITHWSPVDADVALGTGWRGGEPVGLWDPQFNRKYTYAGFANGLKGGI